MMRLYDRVRREFGPEAVIVRTRSLYREGAEPLIELLAAAPDTQPDLALDLQWTMVDGALGRLQIAKPRPTIGDLEDMVAREPDQLPPPRLAAPASAGDGHAGWMEGFVGEAPSTPRGAHDAPAPNSQDPARGPRWQPARTFEDLPSEEAPPPVRWAPRPAAPAGPRHGEEQPAARMFDLHPHAPPRGLAGELELAGLSREAAAAVLRLAPGEAGPAEALAGALAALPTRFPAEDRRALVTLQGPPSAGRTTALLRMALDCCDSGRETVLIAADSSRAAAREQVHAYGEAAGLHVVDAFDPEAIAAALGKARPGACLFADVAAGPFPEIALHGSIHHAYLAIPGHWQRGALEATTNAFDLGAFSGAILTFTDLSTDLTPALSLAIEAGLGIAFLSSGRDVGSGVGLADPWTLASGICPMRNGERTDGQLVASA